MMSETVHYQRKIDDALAGQESGRPTEPTLTIRQNIHPEVHYPHHQNTGPVVEVTGPTLPGTAPEPTIGGAVTMQQTSTDAHHRNTEVYAASSVYAPLYDDNNKSEQYFVQGPTPPGLYDEEFHQDDHEARLQVNEWMSTKTKYYSHRLQTIGLAHPETYWEYFS